jgi:hypothetical protein
MGSESKTSPLYATRSHLEQLHEEINQGFLFDTESITSVVDQLKTDSHNLTRKRDRDLKAKKSASIDPTEQKELLNLIKKIEQSHEFIEQLGSHQMQFIHTLHEIKKHVQDWKSKIEKADNDRN